MSNVEVDILGVVKQLQSLNEKKSYGPDCIPISFLSDYAEAIAPNLKAVYNRSFKEGSLPKDWKVAQVILKFQKAVGVTH